jgi:aryl-alcohol dehydrogenase-like predicted oxidoreductase
MVWKTTLADLKHYKAWEALGYKNLDELLLVEIGRSRKQSIEEVKARATKAKALTVHGEIGRGRGKRSCTATVDAGAIMVFALAYPAVCTIIAGIRNVQQTEANVAASDLSPLTSELLSKLHERAWLRGFWYSGKYYSRQVMVWLIGA